MHIVADIDSILAPISVDQPVGVDIRIEAENVSLYHEIRTVRSEARNTERAALAIGENDYFAKSHWTKVVDLIEPVLVNKTKDLELCAWYIEALTRLYGFKGIEVGYRIAAGLIEQFGQHVFPAPDEDGLSGQLAPLIGLNGYGTEGPLVPVIRSLALTQDIEPGPLSTWQCEQIFLNHRAGSTPNNKSQCDTGDVTPDDIAKLVAHSEDAFFQQLIQDIDSAIEVYARFERCIERYAVKEPQPTRFISDSLQQTKQLVSYLLGDRHLAITESLGEARVPTHDVLPIVNEPISGTKNTGAEQLNCHSIHSRNSAIAMLKNIGAYFKETEPHSPISYLIDQACRWSALPLDQLIEELIPDESARKYFQNLSGMVPLDKGQSK